MNSKFVALLFILSFAQSLHASTTHNVHVTSDETIRQVVSEAAPTASHPLRALLIDGGGIRGVVPAVVLEKLEEGSRQRIHQIFPSGITGTSTGAILAAALSCDRTKLGKGDTGPYPAQVIADFYKRQGGHIFNDAFIKGQCCTLGCSDCCSGCCDPCKCCACEYQYNSCKDCCCDCGFGLLKCLFCCWLPCCKESDPQAQITRPYEERSCCSKFCQCLGTGCYNCCGCCGPQYSNVVLLIQE